MALALIKSGNRDVQKELIWKLYSVYIYFPTIVETNMVAMNLITATDFKQVSAITKIFELSALCR